MIVSWFCIAAVHACISLAAEPSAVRAETIEGQSVAGTWAGLTDDGALALSQNGKSIVLRPSDLLSVSWPPTATMTASAPDGTPSTSTAPASAPAEWPAEIHLKDGSRFPARITAGDGQQVLLDTPLLDQWNVPLSLLAAIRFTTGSQSGARSAFDQALTDRTAVEDTLLVAGQGNIQKLGGAVQSLGPQGGAFLWRQRTVPIQPGRTIGIVFAAGAASNSNPPKAACHLRDGSIWCGSLTGGDATAVRLLLGAGRQVSVPVALLQEIRFASDRVVFLSDLTPADYKFEPWGVTRWLWRRDRSAANRPLRIAGQPYERGIGMHSKATLTYVLDGQFTHLAAVIGIDDDARPRGNAVFRVTADGKEVFTSGPVTGRDPPRPILVPIHKARTLQLIIDFGADLDLGDQADWCNVRVIKQGYKEVK